MIKRIVPFLAALLLLLAACSHSSGGGGGGGAAESGGDSSATPTATELAVITEMNFARTRPAEYVIQRLVPQQSHPTLMRDNINAADFQAALAECIAQMNVMTPIGSLSAGNGLYKAAREWVQKQGAGSSTGHQSGWDNRVRKYVTATVVGENISYGYSTPEEIVAALLIDFGPNNTLRGHRCNILELTDTNGRTYGPYTHAGVSIGSHGAYNIMCCINYAGGNYADK